MILLRLACLAAGIAVLVAPPAMLFPNGAVTPNLLGALAMALVLMLAASAFFFITFSAHRIKRSPALRRLCVMLLGAPFLAGIATLWFGTDPNVLWMGGLLLSFTLVTGLALVYPILQGPSASRLRARDARPSRREPVLYQA